MQDVLGCALGMVEVGSGHFRVEKALFAEGNFTDLAQGEGALGWVEVLALVGLGLRLL